MMRPQRRRRAGEWGQGFWEWAVLGGVMIAMATAATTLVGGYLAVTYDQHHSSTPLGSAEAAPTATPEPPSIVYVDFSPVGLNESCILAAAAKRGLTWDGGELGWTAASNPRPPTSVSNYSGNVLAWRARMTGLLTAAAASADWQACLKPQLTPPPERTAEPTETLTVDGSYTIDPSSVQGIGGCSSDMPTSLTVSGGGSSATVYFGSNGFTMQGGYDASSNSLQAQADGPNGLKRTLRGTLSSNAGVTRFSGSYDTEDQTSGCGYQFTAERR